MNKLIKKITVMWILLGLFVSTLQLGAGTAAAASAPDGEYAVNYFYLEDGKTTLSVAQNYMRPDGQKGKLIINGGTATFEHELTQENYNSFPYLGFRKEGSPKAVISNNVVTGMDGYQTAAFRQESGKYIVQYEIADITKNLDILMHVNIQGFGYDHWYRAHLSIDISSLPGVSDGGDDDENNEPTVTEATYAKVDELITVAESVYNTATEGTNYGDYPTGSKAALHSIILFSVNSLDSTPSGDTVAYGKIYNMLKGALDLFQSQRKLADRTELLNLISTLNSFVSKAKVNGETEGLPGSVNGAIMVGEYFHSNIDHLKNQLQQAVTTANTPTATPDQLATRVSALASAYNQVLKYQYVADKPMRIYALDTLDKTDEQSVYADELSLTLPTVIQKDSHGTLYNIMANIAIDGLDANAKVIQSMPSNDGSFNIVNYPFFTYYATRASTLSTGTKQVYQLSPIGGTLEDLWEGLGYISYEKNGVTREIYISYNVEQLEQLQASVTAARQLYADAVKSSGADQAAFDHAKSELLAAIDKASETAGNLAAKRPQIRTEQAALTQALSAFKAQASYKLNFSTVHATDAAFSSMESYFGKPALVEAVNGESYVSFTVLDSSTIREVKVEHGGVYEDATVVSEDTAANTRVIQFKASDLSVLQNAKVRVVTSYAGQVHDQTYTIRLNFNGTDNSLLQAAIQAAKAKHRAAAAGTQAGQYPESAKSALLAAITQAGALAADVQGTQAQTDAALSELNAAIAAFEASVIQPGELASGEYLIDFKVLKYGTDDVSVMNGYVISPGRLKVVNGEKTVYFTLKQSKEIIGLKINGTDASVESENAEANTRVVFFPVSDLSTRTNGWVKINWPAANYINKEYDIQVAFDESSIIPIGQEPVAAALLAEIAAVKKLSDTLLAGTGASYYSEAVKQDLQAAIQAAQHAATNGNATEQQLAEAQQALLQAVSTFLSKKQWHIGSFALHLGAVSDEFGGYIENSTLIIDQEWTMKWTFTPKQNVTIAKLIHLKTGEEILPEGSATAARASVSILSAASGDIAFKLPDLLSPYKIVLTYDNGIDAVQVLDYDVTLSAVTTVAEGGTNTGGGPVAGGLEDGTYYIDFRILKYGTDSTSVMQEYVISPALLRVMGGSKTASFTVIQSKEVTGLKFNGSSVSVESRNAEENTRVVSFNVSNLSSKIDGWVKIDWPEVNYFHEYSIQLQFDPNTLRAAAPGASAPGVGSELVKEKEEKQDAEEQDVLNESFDVSFNDIGSHWARASIEQAVRLGIVNGYADGTFRPNGVINRGEFAVILSRALKLKGKGNENLFNDYKQIPEWARTHVARAAKEGWIGGYADQTFRADVEITRAELAVIIARAAGLELVEDDAPDFADAGDIPAWAQKEVAAAVRAGLIQGKQDNQFDPNAKATRAEALTLIIRLLETIAAKEQAALEQAVADAAAAAEAAADDAEEAAE